MQSLFWTENKEQEEFEREVNDLTGGEFRVIGEYIDAHTEINIKHERCENEFPITPNAFLSHQGCPKCRYIKSSETQRKEDEVFLNEVKELVGDEYTIIGKYKNNKTDIEIEHYICGEPFKMTPKSFLRGSRCPICRKRRQSEEKLFSEDDVVKRLKNLIGNEYIIMTPYKGMKETIYLHHNKEGCHNVYPTKLGNFFSNGNRCPECSKKKKLLVKRKESLKLIFIFSSMRLGGWNILHSNRIRR